MSLGGLLGAVAGGIIGFFIGGPSGAFMGASIGFSLGMMVDPVAPDVKSPGMAVEPLQVTSNIIGTPIPDLLGTSKITGFLLAYGLERAEPQYTKVSGGKGGGGKKSKELTGYKYYASWQLGICFGPADELYAIYKNDNDAIWEGELTRPVSGGVETVAIEGVGAMRFYFGTDDQPVDATAAALIGDATLNSPLKGLCCVVFDDCCIGTYNRLPTMSFVLRRTPTIAFSDKHQIQGCDYNPMHAIWYWLSVLGGLPETWLHSVDFAAVALALHGENRGITALLNQQQSLETYIETVNAHIDAILRYGCDGAFHPKLIRDDYDPDELETIDETMLLDKPEFGRGSWIGTINEVKVQYSEITNRPFIPFTGDFFAFDMCSDGTFFYICGRKSYADPTNHKCVVAKVRISNLELIQMVEYDFGVNANDDSYYSIAYSDDFIYLAGWLNNSWIQGGSGTAVVHKRPTSDLSILSWEYTFSEAGKCCYFRDLVVDDDNVFAVGDYDSPFPAKALKVRLAKTNGDLVWVKYITGNAAWGVSQYEHYIYIHENVGGVISIEKFAKIQSPSEYVIISYGDQGGLFRGCIGGVPPQTEGLCIYVSGPSPSQGDSQGMLMKINLSTMVETWQRRRNQATTGDAYDFDFKCVQDGVNVFTIGQTGVTPPYDQVLQKFDLEGNLEITKIIANPGSTNYYYWYTILELGNYIYLCNYYGIERRLKSTLEIG